jgi:hypothetical protein
MYLSFQSLFSLKITSKYKGKILYLTALMGRNQHSTLTQEIYTSPSMSEIFTYY